MAASLHSKALSPRNGGTSPLIARILGDEYYYRDGPPNWSKARSSKQAKKARKSYVKRLRRFAPQFPEAKPLAKVLARCKPRRRCMDGGCPECTRAFQRAFVAGVAPLADDADHLIRLSIVFPDYRADEDKLHTLDTTSLLRFVSEMSRRAHNLNWAIGGVDLSLNDDSQKGRGIQWQPQLYVIADARDVGLSLSTLLRDRLHSSEIAHRPVQVKACDGTEAAVSYAFKTDFVRRIGYWGRSLTSQNPRKSWHTRKISLRPVEHVQALIWMHKIGLHGRLLLHGVRMTRQGDGVSLARIKQLK
jgi:hypothetical protein